MTDVVGPVPTIRFHDGTVTAYDPPRNTCDPRYIACTNHRAACDCREALWAEDKQEYRAAMDDAKAVIAHLIDAPCPAQQRRDCTICRAALTTWLGRFDAVWPHKEVPF